MLSSGSSRLVIELFCVKLIASVLCMKNRSLKPTSRSWLQTFDLRISRAALLATREHIGHPRDSLPLLRADLVKIKLMFSRHILHGLVALQRLQ